jgi:16S rRNA processing protein RimM
VALNNDTLVALGFIQKPRGLSGELVVGLYQPDSEVFRSGLSVVIRTKKTFLHTKIEYVKKAGHRLGVKFEHIDDRKAAEVYAGGEIVCRFGLLPKKKSNEFYVFHLIGMKVVDSSGEVFGEVLDVLNLPANDVLVLNTPEREVMVPFVKQIVKSVSLDEMVIVVDGIKDFFL